MSNLPYIIPDCAIHGNISSSTNAYVIAYTDGRLIKGPEGIIFQSIPKELLRELKCRIFLGTLHNISWWAIGISITVHLPPHYTSVSLRELGNVVEPNILGITCRAVQLVRFDALNSFCGFCGSSTSMKEDEIAKICSSCGRIIFPRLSPAVIVRITDRNKILLSRSPHFPAKMYSVQAGFVEPGESLENTVHREVREEIGIEISDLTYFGSQPWPFPDSLMIGFTARYAGGDITPDNSEIEDAGWFSVSDLPQLPGHDSIARALIEDWVLQTLK